MKLAIFDFCDTLVNFQSADAFVRFSLKRRKRFSSLLIQSTDKVFSFFKFYSVLRKLNLSRSLQKQLLLRGMKGMTREEITESATEFEKTVIQNKLNTSIYNLMLEHIENKDEVIINSGGYDVYLEVFAKKLGITKLYATKLKFENDKFSGSISGNDCLHQEKITRMNTDGIDFKEYTEIYVYSDSITDMPIFNIATHKVAVIKSDIIPGWCQGNSFQIIKV